MLPSFSVPTAARVAHRSRPLSRRPTPTVNRKPVAASPSLARRALKDRIPGRLPRFRVCRTRTQRIGRAFAETACEVIQPRTASPSPALPPVSRRPRCSSRLPPKRCSSPRPRPSASGCLQDGAARCFPSDRVREDTERAFPTPFLPILERPCSAALKARGTVARGSRAQARSPVFLNPEGGFETAASAFPRSTRTAIQAKELPSRARKYPPGRVEAKFGQSPRSL
jgi:hypothetical protein